MGDWQSIVVTKQERVKALVPSEWRLPSSIISSLKFPLAQNPNNLIALDIPRKSGILSEKELDITENYEVRQLLDALATGKFSAEDVVTAYCKRAAIAQELAIERARGLDKIRSEKGTIVGPLHGLPISIKDMFDVKGSDSSIGFVSLLNKPKEESAVIVHILEKLGAVVYVKTNIPQTMLCAESDNNIFGRVLNPHNTSLTAGGSSGGEGALIALRGSPIGIGTDIGGSIRIPGLCCGTYAFKPSANRVPTTGWTAPGLPGWGTVMPCAGPLANSVDALEIFMKAVLDAHPAALDTMALDIPWRQLEPLPRNAKLTIGLMAEDPAYPLQPPMKRALADASQLLASQGHKIVPLSASSCRIADASEVCWQMFGLDTDSLMNSVTISGEPLINALACGRLKPANDGAFTFVPPLEELDLKHKVATLNIKRFIIQDALRKTWYDNGLDVIIGPGAQNTAVKHDTYGWVPYTVCWNLLDYPSCIIPFGKASKEKDPEVVKIDRERNVTTGPDYIPEEVDGAPCHVQVITTNLRDEECLRYARIIDQSVNGNRKDVQ